MAPATDGRLAEIMLGTAVGDALELPAEGLSPQRRRRMMPGLWRHRLIFSRGMLSDDTEHTFLVAQSLLGACYGTSEASQGSCDVATFQRRLASQLRWSLASLPPGVGLATARARLKLWLGFSSASGVFSAGNGPAMRSALIGGCFCDQPESLDKFIRVDRPDPHGSQGVNGCPGRCSRGSLRREARFQPSPRRRRNCGNADGPGTP